VHHIAANENAATIAYIVCNYLHLLARQTKSREYIGLSSTASLISKQAVQWFIRGDTGAIFGLLLQMLIRDAAVIAAIIIIYFPSSGN